jgi:NIPSNAP
LTRHGHGRGPRDYLRYTIDPYQIETFERYSRMILPLTAKYGGVHHGAFLPHEGPNNIAVHCSAFRRWRSTSATGPRCGTTVAKEAWRLAEETRCILSFERSFMRPVFAAEL